LSWIDSSSLLRAEKSISPDFTSSPAENLLKSFSLLLSPLVGSTADCWIKLLSSLLLVMIIELSSSSTTRLIIVSDDVSKHSVLRS